MVAILVMAVTGRVFAQQNDTVSVAKSDTIVPKKTTELPEVGITAKKPVYMTDGEKTMYNVSEDPAVQSGTAADALQNRAISPCAESHRYRYGLTIDLPI